MEQYLDIGEIVTTHGVTGEMKLYPWTGFPKSLLKIKNVFFNRNHDVPHEVLGIRSQGNMILIRISGINSMEDAHRLVGTVVSADRNEIIVAKDKVFVADLIGLEAVEHSDGRHIGTVSDVITGGVQDLYVVKLENGEERMVPAVPAFIKKIDFKNSRVEIESIEGLFEDAD